MAESFRKAERESKLVDVIQMATLGKPLKEAAEKVGWQYDTLRTELKREYRSRGAGNIVHLVAMYFRLGLIT